MKATTSLSVTRSKAAASCTTKTSQSQSPKAAGLSTVHFLHNPCFIAVARHRTTGAEHSPVSDSLSKDQDRALAPTHALYRAALTPEGTGRKVRSGSN